MSDTKHTPGPWSVATTHPIPHAYAPCSRRIVAVCGLNPDGSMDDTSGPDGLPGDESLANARIVAAAPDMLSALRDCLESLRRLPDGNDPNAYRLTCIMQAARAIAKAEGA